MKAYYQRQGTKPSDPRGDRLDRDTSGLVIFPSIALLRRLGSAIKGAPGFKQYEALVGGTVAEHGYLDAPIQRDPPRLSSG